MAIDANDPRPPYQQVAEDLRRRIGPDAEYRPGSRLPSIRKLAAGYGISPQTVQNALRELRQEGLVVSQQGRAFFVRDPSRPLGRPGESDRLQERLSALEMEMKELRGRVAALEEDRS